MACVVPLLGRGSGRRALLALLAAVGLVAVRPVAPEGNGFRPVEDFGSNPGNLNMFLYVPGLRPPGPRPLVVALHGCRGSARQFRNTGWESAAWRGKFYVLFPEQRPENHEIACFNHFADNEPEKGEGEIRSIMQMIDNVAKHYPVDRARIFVTGFSSGGQLAVVLAARYPERFAAAVALGSGGFRCAPGHKGIEGFARCVDGKEEPPGAMGSAKKGAATKKRPKRFPRMSFWHGLEDKNVDPKAVTEGVRQWTRFLGIKGRPNRVQRVTRTITRASYTDRQRRVQVETTLFREMAHTIPVRPPYCGREADEYFSSESLCYAWESARFFGLVR